ncbi:hypothetical protein [Kitasatospora arboriphila]|uniref:Uncharacterized protein n=1 Tax=Kitasatospora arboriphila TaxID=258052 RepID=A0ABN1TFA9_9ACTN
MSPKKNRSYAARRAREAQQTGSTTRYTALLRSAVPAAADGPSADEPLVAGLTVLVIGNATAVGPQESERRAWAVAAAEALTSLTRMSSGEAYPAAAEVDLLPAAGEPDEPPYAVATVVAHRPWERAGEWEAVLDDVRAALDPAAGPALPGRFAAALPIGTFAADARRGRRPGQADRVEFTARPAAADEQLTAALDAAPPTWPTPHWPESLDRQAPFRPDAGRYRAAGEAAAWDGLLCLECGCPIAWACPHCPGCSCYHETCPDPDLRHRRQYLARAGVFLLTAPVPAGTDERELAQQVADSVRAATRGAAGGTYPGRAEVLRLDEPWLPLSGHGGTVVEARLLVCCEAARDRCPDGERDRESAEADLAAAIERGLAALRPFPAGRAGPSAHRVEPGEAQALLARHVWSVTARDTAPLVLRADCQESPE